MKKVYEIIFVDEWNNFNQLGWYENLDDAIDDINKCLEVYANGKYKLQKGDLKEYPGSFGSCIDMDLSGFFAENEEYDEDEVYSEMQSCMIRGFVQTFSDEEFAMYKNIFIDKDKIEVSDLTLDKLLDLIEKCKNKEILEYFNNNKEKAVYELSGDLLKVYSELTENKTYIDFDIANINSEHVKDKKFWNEFLNQYEDKRILCDDDIAVMNPTFIGYQIFQYEFFKYYAKDDNLFIEKWTYYNNKLKRISLYSTKKKEETVS